MNTWRYEIQYGPEGEANYAWLYFGDEMVATMKTHHAVSLSAALASPDLQAENERLRKALENLVKSANECNRIGASTGPQWLKMTVAIVSAKAALERK